jgi:hypothetical protein
MKRITKIVLVLLVVTTCLNAQDKEIQSKLKSGELKMNFPSVYFKNNSTDYAVMPYSVDSCFNYIAKNTQYINDLVMWRDSLESEKLSKQRIKKIKKALHKYKEIRGIPIESMRKEQKLSRHTIEMSADKTQMEYLLSLNSVFEISATRFEKQAKYNNHIMRPRIWCWGCWRSAFHTVARRKIKKIQRERKEEQQSKSEKEKHRRRLVWFGWKSGFHWSSAGKVSKKQ